MATTIRRFGTLRPGKKPGTYRVGIELKPGQKPEAKFCFKKSDVIEVREFCTTHGLWKS